MSCLICASAHVAAAGAMEYRYWDWRQTPKRDDYLVAVLKTALEKTVPEFGQYQLVRVEGDYSTRRVRQEVSEGRAVNIMAAPWRILRPDDPVDRRIPVNVPIMNGLLGYRYLVIRKEDLPRFAAIKQAADLQAMTGGQGRDWAEVGLYRRNGYRLVDSGNGRNLIEMLANKRFDYLPLSVIEAQDALDKHPHLAKTLTVAPSLMISYPLPLIYYVSDRHPELARRLERGLTMASKDGSLDELVRQHFSQEIASMAKVSRHFTMADPAVPKHLLSHLPAPRKPPSH